MLPLFLFILSFCYITWLLMDTYDEAGGRWLVLATCGIGGFLDDWWFCLDLVVLRSQSVVELTLHVTRTCDLHIRGFSGPVSAWWLAYLKQLIMQTVHILQLDSAGTDSLPKGEFLQGNPNLLPNNLARQPTYQWRRKHYPPTQTSQTTQALGSGALTLQMLYLIW
jgi:hypothetical protein